MLTISGRTIKIPRLINTVGGLLVHSPHWTPSWLGISCKMRNCSIDMAINYRAAPIVMKLNFNYSFLRGCGRSRGAQKIICLFFFFPPAVAAASSRRGPGGPRAADFLYFFFCDNRTIIMCRDAARRDMARCH